MSDPSDPSDPSDLHRRPQQIYCPSDALHSKELDNAFRNVVSSCDGGYDILVCHKDKTSFYKSTRKICRTANRICSAFLSNFIEGIEVQADYSRYNGYLIGDDDASELLPGGAKRRYDAIRQRLKSEFDGDRMNVATDMPNVSVNVFRGKGIPRDEEWNVVFIDLDAIVHDSDPGMQISTSYAPQQVHDAELLLQKLLSVLDQHVKIGKNSIIHIKSEVMYQFVTSIGGTCKCVSGVNAKKLLRSMQHESAKDNETSHITGTTIRRLQNKKGASHCPLTIYPVRYIELPAIDGSNNNNSVRTVEICRFHNYDAERGCLRAKKARQNSNVRGCDFDHDHCHRCGGEHRAFECPFATSGDLSSGVFRKTAEGGITFVPHLGCNANTVERRNLHLPSLLVLGGRLRGRTLATCEMLPLSSSLDGKQQQQQWIPLPNLNEHRGSHTACSPVGTGLAFVMGGGTADGNSDAVELLGFNADGSDWRWHMMGGKLSSPRHAFEAVCVTKKKQSCQGETMNCAALYAVGGWKYGAVSCESVERLGFQYSNNEGISKEFEQSLVGEAEWEQCAPLLLPRRLHSVAVTTDGSSIFVFGGYVDERHTTPSVEKYDIEKDKWCATDKLPYGENCPLVQAVAEKDGFLIFPFSTEQAEDGDAPVVLRYTPGSIKPFSSALLPSSGKDNGQQQLRLPISNWHSFSATASTSLSKAFLVGGTINGKWTNKSFELDLLTYEWRELPVMTFARRRLATLVLE